MTDRNAALKESEDKTSGTFWRSTASLGAGEAISAGTQAALGLLLVYWLPPADRGVIVLVMAVGQTSALLADFGLSVATPYIANANGPSAVLGMAKSYCWRSIVSIALAASLGILMYDLLGGPLGAISAAVIAWSTLVNYAIRAFAQAWGYLAAMGAMWVTVAAIRLAGGLVWVVANRPHGVGGLALALGLANLLATALLIAWAVRTGSQLTTSSDSKYALQDDREGRRLARHGFMARSVTLVCLRFDTFLLAALWGTATVGTYGLAATIAELAGLAGLTIGAALYSHGSSGSATPSRSVTVFLSAGMTAAASILGGTFILVATRYDVIDMSYESAALYTYLLVIGATAYSVVQAESGRNFGEGKGGRPARSMAIAGAIIVPLDLLLIPKWGAIAAAIVSSVGYSFGMIYLLAGRRSKSAASPLGRLTPREER